MKIKPASKYNGAAAAGKHPTAGRAGEEVQPFLESGDDATTGSPGCQ